MLAIEDGASLPMEVSMIRVFGPCNPRVTFGPNLVRQPENPFCVAVEILGDALRAYEIYFGVTIEPCLTLLPGQSEYKYFNVQAQIPKQNGLVDIHVFRDNEEMCPRQDLGFALKDGDVVDMGSLAC
jgi:hypothetical protein